jgi:hypothetical protein
LTVYSGGSGGASFTYGDDSDYPESSVSWTTERWASATCNGYNEFKLSASESYTAGGGSHLGGGTLVASSTFANADWRELLGSSSVPVSISSGSIGFGIEVYDGSPAALVKYAGGTLVGSTHWTGPHF